MENDDMQEIKFLSNKPIGKDLFKGKSQENIASHINKAIENPEINIIGLDGSWGSGKSNIIQIVQNQSQQDKECEQKLFFFTYDAWSHQTDIHKRAILEDLVSFLTSNDSLKNQFKERVWKRNIDKLLGKTVQTKTKNVPSFSYGFIISFVTVTLVPIIANFISIDDIDTTIKTIVSLIPIGVLGLSWIIYKGIQAWKKRSEDKKNSDQGNASFFSFYSDKQIENVTTVYSNEISPSVKIFSSFLDSISQTLGDDKLVIVFDNLDRLPFSQVRDLWSCLYTFFSNAVDIKNITVIVPFDRNRIINAFKEEDSKANANDSFQFEHFANDIINKLFDVVYRVSPPILTDWRDFFEMKWHEAFKNSVDDDELSRVMQIYGMSHSSFTPRDIIGFINDCVSVRLINNEGEILMRYIALFVKGKKQLLSKPNSEILKPSFLGGLSFEYAIDEELPKALAALVYQIPMKDALEVVYSDQLIHSLNNGDQEQFKEIIQLPSWGILLKAHLAEVVNLENAVGLLSSPIVKDDSFSQFTSVWDELLSKEIEECSSREACDVVKPYQVILLCHSSRGKDNKQYLKIVFEKMYASKNFSAVNFRMSVDLLEKSKSEIRGYTSYIKTQKVSVETYLPFAKEGGNLAHYKIDCEDATLLVSELEKIDLSDYSKICFLLDIDININPFFDHLQSLLSTSSNPRLSNAKQFENCIILLLNKKHRILITTIEQHFIRQFVASYSNEDFHYEIVAMLFAFAWINENTFDGLYSIQSQEEYIKSAKCIINYLPVDEVLFRWSRYPSHSTQSLAMFKQYITICKTQKDESVKDIKRLLVLLPVIKQNSGVDYKDLFLLFDQYAQYFVLDESSINPGTIPIEMVDEILKQKGSPIGQKYYEALENYVTNRTQEAWINDFSSPASNYSIAIAMKINNKWTEATVNACESVLRKNPQVSDFSSWTIIFNYLYNNEKDTLVSILRNVLSEMLGKTPITNSQMTFWIPWFDKVGIESNDKTMLRIIFPVANLSSLEILSLLKTNYRLLKIAFEKGEEEEKSRFSKSIIGIVAQKNTNAQFIADKLGINNDEKEGGAK